MQDLRSWPIAFARPKSSTFTVPSVRTLTLAGFKSRCTMPASWAASSASAICFAIGSASSIGIGPRAMRCGQILAFDELHHERVLFDTVDVRDVGMIERREDFRFALESREAFAIVGDIGGQDLDRHFALQLRIARAIDLAHAAGAELADDFVHADPLTRGEGHWGCADYSVLNVLEQREPRRTLVLCPDMGTP